MYHLYGSCLLLWAGYIWSVVEVALLLLFWWSFPHCWWEHCEKPHDLPPPSSRCTFYSCCITTSQPLAVVTNVLLKPLPKNPKGREERQHRQLVGKSRSSWLAKVARHLFPASWLLTPLCLAACLLHQKPRQLQKWAKTAEDPFFYQDLLMAELSQNLKWTQQKKGSLC